MYMPFEKGVSLLNFYCCVAKVSYDLQFQSNERRKK
jgi:hypothetical protein